MQPHINAAVAAAQPHVDRAKNVVANTISSYGTSSTVNTTEEKGPIAPTTAPLEAGPHTVSNPYPQGLDVKVGEA